MADDQKPKTMDINDLVRELSKSSTNPEAPTPPSVPSSQPPKPPVIPPKPQMSPPMASSGPSNPAPKPFIPATPPKPPMPRPLETPRPQFSVSPQPITQPKPAPTPPTTPPSATTPGIKEYKSSIRTMGEDISKIKQGQQPAGVPVPRKVEQAVPQAPQSVAPKPAMPSQQFKVPSVNLGETQKTGPIAQSKDFSRPKSPPGPSVQGAPKTESGAKIYVPEGGPKAENRNMLFLGIGAVALVAGFSYWFFVLWSPTPDNVIETPTPTPTATPVQDLSSIFSGLAEVGTEIAYEDHQSTDQKGEFIKLKDTQNKNTLGLSLMLDWLVPPQNVKDNLGNESLALLFVQSEFFDTKGQIKISDLERRFALVVEVKDAFLLSQAVNEWEATIANEISSLWNINKSKQGSITFLDNTYRGASIRYKNFPYSDRSIDYAIVTALNGKSYLVVTGSREAMYATIDKLKGF